MTAEQPTVLLYKLFPTLTLPELGRELNRVLSGYIADNMFDKICRKLLPLIGEGRDGEVSVGQVCPTYSFSFLRCHTYCHPELVSGSYRIGDNTSEW